MTTTTVYPASSASDTNWAETPGVIANNLPLITVGDNTNAGYGNLNAAIRFVVTIPNGATINSAILRLTCGSTFSTGATCNLRLSAIDEASPSVPATYAAAEGATRTTATVNWSNVPNWTNNVQYSSPDIKTILQELADSYEVTAIVIYIEDAGSANNIVREFDAFDAGSGYPELYINYTPAAQTIALEQATETEAAQAIGALKVAAIGQASETNSAQTIASAKTTALNIVTETEAAHAISALKAAAIGQASETDSAQPISLPGTLTATVNQAVETDAAQAVTSAKRKPVGQAAETDSAQAISLPGELIGAINQAAELETAQTISPAKTKAIALVAEVDAAQAVSTSKGRVLGAVSEADYAQAITRNPQTRILGLAAETDTAQAIIVTLGEVAIYTVILAANLSPLVQLQANTSPAMVLNSNPTPGQTIQSG